MICSITGLQLDGHPLSSIADASVYNGQLVCEAIKLLLEKYSKTDIEWFLYNYYNITSSKEEALHNQAQVTGNNSDLCKLARKVYNYINHVIDDTYTITMIYYCVSEPVPIITVKSFDDKFNIYSLFILRMYYDHCAYRSEDADILASSCYPWKNGYHPNDKIVYYSDPQFCPKLFLDFLRNIGVKTHLERIHDTEATSATTTN